MFVLLPLNLRPEFKCYKQQRRVLVKYFELFLYLVVARYLGQLRSSVVSKFVHVA